jgi:bacteriocin-like protein
MSTDKIDPKKEDAKISSADDLVKSGDVELSEEELKRVSGGIFNTGTGGEPKKVKY